MKIPTEYVSTAEDIADQVIYNTNWSTFIAGFCFEIRSWLRTSDGVCHVTELSCWRSLILVEMIIHDTRIDIVKEPRCCQASYRFY